MRILGLTGSIGMGKSTVSNMFRKRGVPVFDADATVHELYAGPLVTQIEAAFPGTTNQDGVDRALLSAALNDDVAMKKLEGIVHPAVAETRHDFLEAARQEKRPFVVLDIPLLFETGGEARVDKVILVSAPAEIQKARVLARPGMTEEKFESIRARQVPDAEKRIRSDVIIDTGVSLEETQQAVDDLIASLADQ